MKQKFYRVNREIDHWSAVFGSNRRKVISVLGPYLKELADKSK